MTLKEFSEDVISMISVGYGDCDIKIYDTKKEKYIDIGFITSVGNGTLSLITIDDDN